MNEDAVEKMKRDIREAAKAAMMEYLEKEVETTREALSIPVGREKGRIIRSNPGENPRKEEGDLQKSIQQEVIEEGGEIVGDFFTTDEKAPWLNFGREDGSLAPRPFWDFAKQRLLDGAEQLENTFFNKIAEGNTPVNPT
jgi:hypothetical protein